MNFEEYRADWLVKHPSFSPQPPRHATQSGGWIQIGILCMFVAAAAISGAHTVPTIYATLESNLPELLRVIVSVSGFAAVELAMFLTSYARMVGNRTATVNLTLGVTVLMALFANVTSTAKALNAGADGWSMVVSIVMGVGVPLVALLAGEMVAHSQQQRSAVQDAAWSEYRTKLQALDRRILSDYEKAFPSLPPAVPMDSNGNSIGKRAGISIPSESTLGHRKRPNATELVESYLRDHPEGLELDGLELARVVGVGKSTAYTVLKQWKQSTPISNGNGHHDDE